MEPIQPVQAGAAESVFSLSATSRSSTSVASSSVSSSGMSGVTSAISDMLSSIGGGLEKDQMLKAMIALLIMAAMLQEMFGGGNGDGQSLQSLGNGRGDAVQGMAMNASSFSFEYTSISFSSTTFTQSGEIGGVENLGQELDIDA